MTATQADSEDYQHWPDDESLLQAPPSAAAGFDTHNGLRSHYYAAPPAKSTVSAASTKTSTRMSKASKGTSLPASIEKTLVEKAVSEKAASIKAPTEVSQAQAAAAPKILPYPQQQQFPAQFQAFHPYPQFQPFMTYPPMQQYTYAQPPGTVPYGVPAYYPYPPQAMPAMPGFPPFAYPPAAAYVYQPPYTAPQPTEWKGRTKAEVDEDNMKIAAKEDAYGKRKIQPIGVKDDEMFWVVELDGSHTLRTFLDIKELKGDFKKDPRYEDAYYFVREAEEEAKEEKTD
ncbi:hypothetical protein KC343_g15694 [Hortaea werneckii]|uniref:Uncharacterized protein n=1 Tax=Hortaea werneckii TaxID=91943 RepID=A0A3M7HUJ3_HORWE|nr:hypothetical protein KC338_g6403 [Hortaea werneckii]KAI6867959.1 hypothetical protein KC323_g3287 [Hortaea werneckii]KAI7545312.1 hypothetical protein KC317_g15754 [Hortaea werneckii]KAI7594502.1 hypothetical protein KC346_g15615 [Hortaea werneckii]KAI7600324.1 hypothetical protein KC343_g15694 [Hortaea werneckii]